MAVSSAPEPEEVAGALRQWLAARFPGEVTDVEAPVRISGGFDFWVYGLRFGGAGLPAEWTAPLVARIPAAADRFAALQRESRLQAWVAAQGYLAPPFLELMASGEMLGFPVQVMKRLPGTTMAAAIAAAPWRGFHLVGRMGMAQASLHRLAVPDWAQAGTGWSVTDRRLALPRRLVERSSHPGSHSGSRSGLAAALDRIEPILPLLEVPEPVICHGDFHPGNLLVDDGSVGVIDWTDAGIGDRHGDIAHTVWIFRFIGAAPVHRAERVVARTAGPALTRAYLSAYRRELPVEPARLRLWMPLQALHAWAVTVADEQGFFGDARAGHMFGAGLGDWAERQFRRSMEALR